MGSVSAQPVRHINPYRQAAKGYRDKYWAGVLPIPYGEKHPPPTGFTGHAAPYPTPDQIESWCENGERYNICLRLAGVSKEFEVIGIDVDHYTSGGKDKRGGDQLAALENQLGVLPWTWISSARTDGVSGIRYFRVPRGLAFRGKIDKDIECIQKGHRFAVVWPSRHPDGGTYTWFGPGADMTVPPAVVEIPDARNLPELPRKWLDYLTQNNMSVGDLERIDMDSSVDEIYKWADATFHGDSDSEMCSMMKKKLDGHKKAISEDATSHDKIINAHYNLLSLAAEGHIGWVKAVNEIEQFWVDDVVSRDKRSRDELVHEIWRSRTNALRKIKAKIDGRVAIGAAGVDTSCLITGLCGSKGQSLDGVVGAVTGQSDSGSGGGDSGGDGGDGLDDVPRGAVGPVGEYSMNDDGNAQHFLDMFSSIGGGIGPSFRYVKGKGWIVWHDGDNPHWELDQDGNQSIRRMWQMVKNRQQDYAENALYPAYIADLNNFTNGAGGVTANDVKASKAQYEKWRRFAELSGNNRQAESAIRAAVSLPEVAIDINTLDSNPYLMGVQNGVLELDGENVRLRKARATDYVTLNTNVRFENPSEYAAEVWQNYLDTFLPDPELQRAVQVIFGHCIIGGNREKVFVVMLGGTNTGKSTMVSALEKAMGDYAMTGNTTIFQPNKFNAVLAQALSKRLLLCSELEAGDDLSNSTLKRLTGGNDPITIEIKFENESLTKLPQFVPIFATNVDLPINEGDEALKNRMITIPFNATPERIDRTAGNSIPEVCKVAVLNWLIQGYVEYRRLGFLPRTKSIEDATEESFANMDLVATFMRDRTQSHSQRKNQKVEWQNESDWIIRAGDGSNSLFSKYEMWCNEERIPTYERLTPIKFAKKLQSLGYARKRLRIGDESQWYWVGLKIKSGPMIRTIPAMRTVSVP